MEILVPLLLVAVVAVAFLWSIIQRGVEEGNEVRGVVDKSIEEGVSKLPEIKWDLDDLICVDVYKKNGALSCREIARLGFDKEKRQFVAVWASASYESGRDRQLRSLSGSWMPGEILNVQIAINEEKSTITSGKIGGKTGSALLGTVLFGAAGGVIGASGKRDINTQSHDISGILSLALEIQTTNTENPYLYIHFFCASASFDKMLDGKCIEKRASIPIEQLRGSDEFQKAQKWYSLLSGLVQTSQGTKTEKPSDPPNNSAFISEEITRLHSLLKEGVITEAEFTAAKRRLLEASEN